MFSNLPQTSEDFYSQMLSECMLALKMNTYFDNHDSERFDYDGIDRSRIFDARERAYWLDWFFKNHAEIYKAYILLKDEESQRIYLGIIAYRIAGKHSVKIPVHFSEEDEEWENYKKIEKYTNSETNISGMFGNIKHYDFNYQGKRYIADCLGFKHVLHRKQYYYENSEGIKIQPEVNDHVIDGGACLGDTSIVFSESVKDKGMVYAFDPVIDHLEILRHNITQNNKLHIIKPFPYGLSNTDSDHPPHRIGKYSPGFNTNQESIPLRTTDTLAINGDIENIDYLKLDIEGSELAALKGATASIRRFKPKLAISLYHKPNDFFQIPIFIKENFPDYQMHIGHYTIHNEETVLYCIDKTKL